MATDKVENLKISTSDLLEEVRKPNEDTVSKSEHPSSGFKKRVEEIVVQEKIHVLGLRNDMYTFFKIFSHYPIYCNFNLGCFSELWLVWLYVE